MLACIYRQSPAPLILNPAVVPEDTTSGVTTLVVASSVVETVAALVTISPVRGESGDLRACYRTASSLAAER